MTDPADGERGRELARLVADAQAGDRSALEALLAAVVDDIYGLSLKMLWHPTDAEDATQEILVKVFTHLGDFRGEARFTTWVFRIAANHLLTMRKRRAERSAMSLEGFGRDLADGLADRDVRRSAEPEERLLEEEVKIGCTQGMLLCLDREHRLAYVLGEIFGVSSEQGGEILEITPEAYRKRLSRARSRIRGFMSGHCGLVDEGNACRCRRRIDRAIELGRVDPDSLLFAGSAVRSADHPSLLRRVEEVEDLHRTAAVFRTHPDFAAPGRIVDGIQELLSSGRHSVLQAP